MSSDASDKTDPDSIDTPKVQARAAALLQAHQLEIRSRTDRLFMGLLVFQWVGGIALALWFSPRSWNGATSVIHPHVWEALGLGGLLLVAPLMFGVLKPGAIITRHIIAAAQMLNSALLIHLGGGRIEMHFHVFGSLAFLAFYRDWRVLITASAVVAADHLVRGGLFPESTYGIINASPWRWLEHASWVVFEDLFLITACLQGTREMQIIAQRQAELEHSNEVVEEKVQLRTKELREAQQELVTMARSAGKAEIASSVLHNVGNVLNSVNVSLRLATAKVQESPAANLGKAAKMLKDHEADMVQFLSADVRGKQLPGFLLTVAEVMSEEQVALLEELNSLGKNVDHIKQIVDVQQSNAKAADISEKINIVDLIEDALRMNLLGDGGAIDVQREFEDLPEIFTDKHVILQILVNLMSNAKHALVGSGAAEQRLIVRAQRVTGEKTSFIRVQVQDNGMGIDAANLTRIFNYGFTTKTTGHGFGLHSAANAARKLGGSLGAQSDGPGRGAIFSLELPIEAEVRV